MNLFKLEQRVRELNRFHYHQTQSNQFQSMLLEDLGERVAMLEREIEELASEPQGILARVRAVFGR